MNTNRRIMIIGSVWMTLSTFLSRFGSFLTQVILGWILVENDFALYAIAISISTLMVNLRNGGASQLLIKNGANYESIASIYFKYSLVFNCMAMLILFILAPIAEVVYSQKQLSTLIYIIAIAIPLSTPAVIFRTKLAIDKRFGSLAKLGLISNISRQIFMVIFAISGFGAYSFVLPIIIVALLETIIGYWYVREWPVSRTFSIQHGLEIFKDAKWILLGSLAVGLSLQGDILTIGYLEELRTVGLYFFGYQLVFTIATLFNTTIESVCPPILTKISDSIQKLKIIMYSLLSF